MKKSSDGSASTAAGGTAAAETPGRGTGLALYRAYRPGTLAEVIGQDHITVPLARAVDSGRAHHAYLFTGPRGCGKTSSARILARCLNCEQGPTSTPCGACRSCIDLAPNGPGSVDVLEIDAATHGGVDEARDLRERAVFAPAQSRYRVYIIDEAHQLSNAAANALLKLIEEPPAHLKFVFATTEPDKIIGTIRSRTHHYPFRLIPARVLQQHLAWVCEQEGIAYEEGALTVVARAAAGSARDSLSILGQVLAGAGPQGLVETDVVAQLGVTDRRILEDVVDAVLAADGSRLFDCLHRVVDGGTEPRRFAGDLLERLRDLVLLGHVPEPAVRELIDAPDAAYLVMQRQAGELGRTRAAALAAVVSQGIGDLRGATAPRLQLELLCARLLSPSAEGGAFEQRLDALERKVDGLPAGGSAREAARAVAVAAASQRGTTSGDSAGGLGENASGTTADTAQHVTSAGSAGSVDSPNSSSLPAPDTVSGAGTTTAGAAGPRRSAPSTSPATPASTGGRGRVPPPPAISTVTAAAPAAVSTPTPADAAAAAGIDSPSAAAAADTTVSAELAEVVTVWAHVVESLRQSSRVAWSMFTGSTAAVTAPEVLTVYLPTSGIAGTAARPEIEGALKAAIAARFSGRYRLEFAVAAAAHDDTAGARDDDDVLDSDPPAVDAVAQMLGGTVISEYEKKQ